MMRNFLQGALAKRRFWLAMLLVLLLLVLSSLDGAAGSLLLDKERGRRTDRPAVAAAVRLLADLSINRQH